MSSSLVLTLASCPGHILLGLLLGELLYRVVLILEGLNHLKERHRGSRVTLIQDVFSNCHQQLFTSPLLCLLGLSLLSFTSSSLASLQTILSLATVYTTIRCCGAMDNTLEDMQVLEEEQALLGPGLATNYWFGFLTWMMKGLKESMDIAQGALEDGDELGEEIEEEGGMIGRLANTENFRIFKKLIILLPSSCSFGGLKKQEALREENVFLHCAPDVDPEAPDCDCDNRCHCHHANCSHDFLFEVEGNKRQPPKKMSFNWIYEREEDERTRNPEGKKIFVMFDFPQILQSALGSLQAQPDLRAKNVETFSLTLASFLHSQIGHSDMVTFQPYSPVAGRRLASHLRERILLERQHLVG